MSFVLQPWQVFFVTLAAWVNREQQAAGTQRRRAESSFAETTSPVGGAKGIVFIDPSALSSGSFTLGDVNQDGEVNGLDVDPFVEVLLSGTYQAEADMNEDQVVNGLDVDPFVEAVIGGGGTLQAIPEPST